MNVLERRMTGELTENVLERRTTHGIACGKGHR